MTKSGQTGYIQRDGYSNVSYQPGVWNVMPVRHYDHGNFIAGKGPGAAFDFGFAIVTKLAGKAKADEVKAGMLLA